MFRRAAYSTPIASSLFRAPLRFAPPVSSRLGSFASITRLTLDSLKHSSAHMATSAAANAVVNMEIPTDSQPIEESKESMEEDVVIIESSIVSEEKTPALARKRSTKKAKQLEYDVSRYHPQALVSKLWIGVHVSAAGGVSHAIENAALIGATAFALDTKSKRKWESPPLDKEEAARFRSMLSEFHMTPDQVLPHGSYLMNLGSPNEETYTKSKACLLDELERCKAMGLHLYNFHPGSTCNLISREDCMRKIASTLNWAHKLTADPSSPTGGVVTVLENMAGQGGVVGTTFEDLKFMIDLVEDKRRVGVCIDTCHAFAAGIDLRTSEDVKKMIDDFDRIVGLKYLRGMHLNDSKGALNCKKDRHEHIGKGQIGNAGFKALMNCEKIHNIPLILETPNAKDPKKWIQKYSQEISALYEMEQGALPETREGIEPFVDTDPPEKKKRTKIEDEEDEDMDEEGEDDEVEVVKVVSKKKSTSVKNEAIVRSKSSVVRSSSVSRSKKKQFSEDEPTVKGEKKSDVEMQDVTHTIVTTSKPKLSKSYSVPSTSRVAKKRKDAPTSEEQKEPETVTKEKGQAENVPATRVPSMSRASSRGRKSANLPVKAESVSRAETQSGEMSATPATLTRKKSRAQ